MAIATINNPDKIECTLQFTMTLKDWKGIRKTLENNTAYCELKIINKIRDLTIQLEQTFYDKVSDE